MRLMQGNCLEVMKGFESKSIDLIVADLPYGVVSSKWDVKIPPIPLFAEYKRILKAKGAIILFANMRLAVDLIVAEPKWFRYDLIWEKTRAAGYLDARRRPLRSHELMLVFAKGLTTYNPQKTEGEAYIRNGPPRLMTGIYKEHMKLGYSSSDGMRFPHSVFEFANPNYKALHKTAKPIPLLEYLIKTYSNEGELVLDNVMGSGGTGVAAINTNRDFIGIEMNEEIFKAAEIRINERLKERESNEN